MNKRFCFALDVIADARRSRNRQRPGHRFRHERICSGRVLSRAWQQTDRQFVGAGRRLNSRNSRIRRRSLPRQVPPEPTKCSRRGRRPGCRTRCVWCAGDADYLHQLRGLDEGLLRSSPFCNQRLARPFTAIVTRSRDLLVESLAKEIVGASQSRSRKLVHLRERTARSVASPAFSVGRSWGRRYHTLLHDAAGMRLRETTAEVNITYAASVIAVARMTPPAISGQQRKWTKQSPLTVVLIALANQLYDSAHTKAASGLSIPPPHACRAKSASAPAPPCLPPSARRCRGSRGRTIHTRCPAGFWAHPAPIA